MLRGAGESREGCLTRALPGQPPVLARQGRSPAPTARTGGVPGRAAPPEREEPSVVLPPSLFFLYALAAHFACCSLLTPETHVKPFLRRGGQGGRHKLGRVGVHGGRDGGRKVRRGGGSTGKERSELRQASLSLLARAARFLFSLEGERPTAFHRHCAGRCLAVACLTVPEPVTPALSWPACCAFHLYTRERGTLS